MYDLLFLNVITYFIMTYRTLKFEYGHSEKVKQTLQKGANFKCRFNVR